MSLQEVVRWLAHEEGETLRRMTRGCRECRQFMRRIRREGVRTDIRWEDVPESLLDRFSRRLHERLFQY